jgi:hypothetical protein
MKRGLAIGAAIVVLAAGTARGQERDWGRDQRRPRCEDCGGRSEGSRDRSFRRDGGMGREWMPRDGQRWGARSFGGWGGWGGRLRFSGPRFRAGFGARFRLQQPWVAPHRMMLRRPMMFGRSFGVRRPLLWGRRGPMSWGGREPGWGRGYDRGGMGYGRRGWHYPI